MKYLFTLIWCTLVFFACNKNTKENKKIEKNVAGGGCTYTTYLSKVIITKINISNTKDAVVYFAPAGLIKRDTREDAKQFFDGGNDITTENGKALKLLKVNDTITYESSRIKSGQCTPEMSRLLLQKYIYKNDTIL